MFEKYPFYLNF